MEIGGHYLENRWEKIYASFIVQQKLLFKLTITLLHIVTDLNKLNRKIEIIPEFTMEIEGFVLLQSMFTWCKKGFADQFWIPKSLKYLSFHLLGYVTKAWPRLYWCASLLHSMENLLLSQQKCSGTYFLTFTHRNESISFPTFFTLSFCTCSDPLSSSAICEKLLCMPCGTHLRTLGSKSSTTTSHSFKELSITVLWTSEAPQLFTLLYWWFPPQWKTGFPSYQQKTI